MTCRCGHGRGSHRAPARRRNRWGESTSTIPCQALMPAAHRPGSANRRPGKRNGGLCPCRNYTPTVAVGGTANVQ